MSTALRHPSLVTASTLAAALAATLLAAAAPARADCIVRAPALALWVDNDSMALQRKDGGYTSGVRIDAYGAAGAVRLPGEDGLAALMRGGLTGDCRTTLRNNPALGGWYVYQSIYTPAELAQRAPQPRDRPWAGHLQVGRSLEVVGRSGNADVSRRLELAIGAIGSASLAEQSQRAVHQLLGFKEPLGWDNQVRNRVTLTAAFVERRRWRGDGGDLVAHWGATVGNAQSFANAGAMWRWGSGLCDFVAPGTGIGGARLSGSDAPADCRGELPSARYLFAAFEVRAKAYDALIEGTPRNGGNEATMKRLVGDLRLGFSMSALGGTMTYAFSRRSADFEVAGRNGPPQNYGSLTISY